MSDVSQRYTGEKEAATRSLTGIIKIKHLFCCGVMAICLTVPGSASASIKRANSFRMSALP